jgi:pyruvate dehydrogenase E2 component (dihydrolipoamide acetyltransferase)
MPALELAQETGKVLRWLKAPGDRVAKGDPIVEIENDKVTVEIEAPAAGFLGEISAREGDVVPVGRTFAVIAEQPGATVSVAASAPAAAAASASAASVKASPLGRKLAEQHGVDVAKIRTATLTDRH